MKILLVDDSPGMRKHVRLYLQDLPDCEIHEAGDGAEAETMIQEAFIMGACFDLVILDWMMPRFTGLQLLKSLRSTEAFTKAPEIIMLTAETYPEQVEACLKYRVSSYVIKPFSKTTLLEAIAKAIKEKKAANAI